MQASPREIACWVLYDWANSAWSTISITLLIYYLREQVLPGDAGRRAWGWGIGSSYLCAALLSPVLGALADARAAKRGWLAVTALSGALCAACLGLVPPAMPWLIVGLFVCASLMFELSFSFYNGFLPELADETQLNRLSAAGFAAGYLGGGLALALAILLVQLAPRLQLDPRIALRTCLVFMGLWWAGFTLPAVIVLRDRSPPREASLPWYRAAAAAVGEVARTLRHIRRYSMLSLFLLGFLIYNEGIQTVLSQASNFAKDALQMTAGELGLLVLAIQFASLPGALAVGKLADRLGQKPALMLCLAIWAMLLIAGFFVTRKAEFWVLGMVVALVMGGTQSVSRAIMGVMTPPARTAEFFGFFSLSSKATSMVGPVVYVEVSQWQGPHAAILSLLAFVLAGWAIAARVDVGRGRAQAQSASL
jgi:UMF1 family MFS transporter